MQVSLDPFGEQCKTFFKDATTEKKPPLPPPPPLPPLPPQTPVNNIDESSRHSTKSDSYRNEDSKHYDSYSRYKDSYSYNRDRDIDDRDGNSLSKWSDEDKDGYRDRYSKHSRRSDRDKSDR